jgi:ABC-type cobalamin/Fe3+-siderophores transport system ATPase subunit
LRLTSIRISDKKITLRNSSPNLFDIDSISLLIGKNGSGKTLALQSIIKAFNAKDKDLLSNSCELSFDYRKSYNKDDTNKWGVIYYTPAQNRPIRNNSISFLDASKRKIENLFHLDRYSDVLGAFDLKLELVATIKSEHKKIGDLLAESLIKNKNFRSKTIQEKFDFTKASQLKTKLESTSDFEIPQEEFEKLSQSYTNLLSSLSELILDTIIHSTSEARTFSCLATATHIIEKEKLGITHLIEFIRTYLKIDLFPPLKLRRTDLASHVRLADDVEIRLHNFKKAPTLGSRVSYSYHLTTKGKRNEIENSPIFTLCKIDFPAISSGQWAIMKQTIAIYESLFDLAKKKKNPNILLLIDEGDAFLHLEWQRRYIMQINDFLYRCKKDLDIKNLQLILATHSPLLATDIPRDFVCTLDSPDPQPSFAAPLQLILNKSFNSRSIGEFATREINRTLHRIKSGKLENKDLYIIEMIDDPVIKREILYLLKEAKENAN